jgi:hypothetical protein
MWYGQKSIFDPGRENPWQDFVFLFIELLYAFAEEHGISEKEAAQRLAEANKRRLIRHGGRLVFNEPYFEAKWHAVQMLDMDLALKLFDDFDVGVILKFVYYAYNFTRRGEMPPYEPFAELEAYEDFEALPVDPYWEDWYYNKIIRPLHFPNLDDHDATQTK